jgi:hypothetical protein
MTRKALAGVLRCTLTRIVNTGRVRGPVSGESGGQAAAVASFSTSSSSANEGWTLEGTSPRPISTEIWAALPCRCATRTDWMIL